MKKRRSFKTTCSYCGVGCGIVVKKDRKNNLVIEGDKDHPANKGMLVLQRNESSLRHAGYK